MKKVIEIQIPEGYNDAVFDKETNEIKFIKRDTKPRSWEEYCKQEQLTDCLGVYLSNSHGLIIKGCRGVAPFVNEFNAEEEAKAVIALCKLIQLRDAWWGDWRPDWTVESNKYTIQVYYNEIATSFSCLRNRVLAFPTIEMRDEFFDTFRDLIEEAKPLL